MKLPVGLQVYTVRDFAEKDFNSTMLKISEMGYDFVELAGLYGQSPAQVKEILDENNLYAVSAHVPYADLIIDPSKVIEDYISIGCKYIVIPYLDEELRPGKPGFDKVLSKIKTIGKVCVDKGVVLLYHNHDFEFIRMEDGSFGLDYMYSAVPADLLQTELDTCWIKVAGQDPVEYIEKYAGRCPVIHLKDFKGAKSENMYELIGIEKKSTVSEAFAFRPVGYGIQDMPAILDASLKSGASYVFVEQDRSDDCSSLEAAKKSRDYLKTLGW